MTTTQESQHEPPTPAPSDTGSDSAMDQRLIDELRDTLRAETDKLNPDELAKLSARHLGELLDGEGSSCVLWRYLLQSNLSVSEATTYALKALEWRQTNQVDRYDIEQCLFKEMWHLTTLRFSGLSRDGRHQVFMARGEHYRKASNKHLRSAIDRYICYLMFSWDRQNMNNLNKLICVMDVANTTMRNMDLELSRLYVGLSNYLPARFEAVLIVGAPWIVVPFVRLMISFLPERFRTVVRCGTFEELVEPLVGPESVPAWLGGQVDENTNRIAPPNVPWLEEYLAKELETEKERQQLLDDIERSIGWSVDEERRALLRQEQIESEKSGSSNSVENCRPAQQEI